MRSRKEDSIWISISDMMTGLMVIFMFIAINYILQVIEFKFVERDIYNALLEEFEKEIESDDIKLSPNGTVTFNPENKVLFNTGSQYLSRDFHQILDEFLPRYISVVSEYDNLDYVKEIRIEGHTDIVPPANGMDSYEYNLDLSSVRAQNVLKKVRSSDAFESLDPKKKERMEFLFTANGMSFSRALNSNGELSYLNENSKVDNDLSRRVEFRIVTSNEKLANKIYEQE